MSASHVPAAAMDEVFKDKLFSKEVEGWLGRTTPEDRERFNSLYDSLRGIAEAKRKPDLHAEFISSSLGKLKRAPGSGGSPLDSAGPASGRRVALEQKVAPGSSIAAGNGWAYTATRSALGRPETRTTMVALQDKLASATQQQAAAAEAERPSSAPGSKGGDAELAAAGQAAAARRRAISFAAPAGVGAAGAGESYQGPSATGFVAISPHATTYQEAYNCYSSYPDEYDQAVRDTRNEPRPNYTLISQWGDSMRAHSDETHKQYLHTTYNTLNDEVVKLRTDADTVKEREFFKWMLRQKTYYGDLLSKSKAADLEALLAGAPEEQRRDILETLRALHAVADPPQLKSHNQVVHCDVRRMEDRELLAQLREHTRARTMGGVHKRPGTAAAATVDLTFDSGAEGGGGRPLTGAPSGGRPLKPTFGQRRPATAPPPPPPQRAYKSAGLGKDTFKSTVPLQWANASKGQLLSTYLEDFGGAKIGEGRLRPDSAVYRVEATRLPAPTCPYGAVDPHTAMGAQHAAFPVPAGFLAPAASTFPGPQGSTTSRAHFPPRDAADLVAQMRASTALAENGRKTNTRITIPLGPGSGVDLIPSAAWVSEHHAEYVPHGYNPGANFESAAAVKAIFMGPTASTGRVATGAVRR